jgi:hypothetical protein
MKKTTIYGLIFCVLSMSVLATPGSIWTTKNDCGTSQQDVNQFAIGETVFINGANIPEGTTAWDITGQNGGASCDPAQVVANSTITINESGAFCFEAYTIASDDCGEYKATVGNKHDNYRVGNQEVPEFGIIAGMIAIAGAIAGFIFLRKK